MTSYIKLLAYDINYAFELSIQTIYALLELLFTYKIKTSIMNMYYYVEHSDHIIITIVEHELLLWNTQIIVTNLC